MIKNIVVVGAGTMGNGIAHIMALGGCQVILIDKSEEALKRALNTIKNNLARQIKKGQIKEADRVNTLAAITTRINLHEGASNAHLVIEAVTENVDTKLQIFKELDRHTRPDTLLASNTSSVSITKIAAATSKPDKVIGMHFMNPVPVMKLVEVIRGYRTDDDTCNKIMELSRTLGKIPVEVNDYPGFVANRILMPMINEAIYTLHEGVSGVDEIDTVMKLGMAHPMGPLQLADFIGLDVCLAILKVLRDGLGQQKYAPCPLLINMVQAGHLGVKTGNGFYSYKADSKERFIAKRFAK